MKKQKKIDRLLGISKDIKKEHRDFNKNNNIIKKSLPNESDYDVFDFDDFYYKLDDVNYKDGIKIRNRFEILDL